LDYIVAGFGIGAILALVGFALWELYGNVEEPGTSWLSRAAIGLMLGALVIWSVTGVTLVSTIDDSTGSRLVFFTSLVTLVAVAAGSFYYWRIDQAIAASSPRPSRQRAERPAPTAAPDEAELSEWDSWPERVERSSDAPAVVAAVVVADAESFEPEVAAEVVEPLEEPAAEAAEDAGEPLAEPDEVPESEPEAEPDGVPETEIAAAGKVDEVEVEVEVEPEADEAPAEPPSNVLPFRPPAPVEEPAPPDDVDDTEQAVAVVDEAAPAEPEAEEEAEEPEPDRSSNNGSGTPTTFESSLLADIDASTAEGDGRYRSPLLSDLVPDPNELEGVGLAKWRPEARLDASEPEPPRKSRKK
jgi:hypothetical protein